MNIGKKFTTLIKATVHSALSPPKLKKPAPSSDRQAQLDKLQSALADVEAKEQEVANLLKEAQNKADTARQKGDEAEAEAQKRLAAELDAQLKTQSTQAISLAQELDNLSQKPGASQVDNQSETPSASNNGESDDLSARKSRLSG